MLHAIATASVAGAAADLRLLRRPGRHLPVRGAGQAEHGRQVRPARARAGRRRRRDHPVERPARPDHLQDRPRAAGRLHRRPQVLARGARRGLRDRRGRRGRRPAARRAQRRHRRPRGLRAAGPRPAGRQDHLHRVDRGRPADRLDLRRADRPLHPGARRQVRRRHPRRRGHRHRRHHAGPRRVLPLRPGLLVADPDRRHRRSATTSSSRRWPARSRQVRVGDPFDAADADGPAGRRAPARPGRGLHRQGHGRGRDPGHRRRPPGAPRPRLVHRADRVRQRRQLLDHRPGGDLRPGAERHPGRRTRRTPSRSPTTRSTG